MGKIHYFDLLLTMSKTERKEVKKWKEVKCIVEITAREANFGNT